MRLTELTANVTPPSFVSVIVSGAEVVFTFSPGKFNGDGDAVPWGTSPLPLSVTGLGGAPAFVLTGTVNVPVRKPAAVGANTTCTVQLCPAGTPAPQELV